MDDFVFAATAQNCGSSPNLSHAAAATRGLSGDGERVHLCETTDPPFHASTASSSTQSASNQTRAPLTLAASKTVALAFARSSRCTPQRPHSNGPDGTFLAVGRFPDGIPQGDRLPSQHQRPQPRGASRAYAEAARHAQSRRG